MIQRLKNRVTHSENEGGFTLIELLVVIIIIGILLAIAIPSYLSFRDRANQSAAKANVRAAIPAAEAYFADNGTYVGLSLAEAQEYDAGVKNVAFENLTATAYCIENLSTVTGGKQASIAGPGGDIAEAACAAPAP